MVLAKLFTRGRRPLATGALLPLAELDALLDVETDRFAATAAKLAREFRAKRVLLDIEGYRSERQAAANPAVIPDTPDIRGSLYQADLRRLPPMDREEEFRMARRHEFLRGVVVDGFRALGLTAEAAEAATRLPAAEARLRAGAGRAPRGFDRAWFDQAIDQFEALRNLYVEGALYLVLTTVNRYRGLGVDTQDLIQEGNASLFQAIDGFDWRRDVRFRTYAQYWVHQAVLKMLYNSARTVRVPIWVQKLLGKIRRAQEAGRRDGRELSAAEVGARLGVPAEKVEWVLATRRYATSLDVEVGDGEGTSMAQNLPDEAALSIPESIPPGDLRVALAEAMADLPEREQRILQRRFGLDGAEPQTLGEIAGDLGITAERVRQLQNAALLRLQRPTKRRQLQAFVE